MYLPYITKRIAIYEKSEIKNQHLQDLIFQNFAFGEEICKNENDILRYLQVRHKTLSWTSQYDTWNFREDDERQYEIVMKKALRNFLHSVL